MEMFSEVVGRVVPDFPHELRARLFRKLDAFGVGRLAFTELACGMSALSLGTMDEKLRVCFDLFDSEGRCALTLKEFTCPDPPPDIDSPDVAKSVEHVGLADSPPSEECLRDADWSGSDMFACMLDARKKRC